MSSHSRKLRCRLQRQTECLPGPGYQERPLEWWEDPSAPPGTELCPISLLPAAPWRFTTGKGSRSEAD